MKNRDNLPPENYSGKTYAYIAVALTVLGAIAFGLTFTVLGIYSLIASVLFCLGALTFINIQKRKNNFSQLLYIKIAAYVVLGIAVAFFIGGIIWASIPQ